MQAVEEILNPCPKPSQADFAHGGYLAVLGAEHAGQLQFIFLLLIAAAVVLAAIYAESAWSPLAWARLIAAREYLAGN